MIITARTLGTGYYYTLCPYWHEGTNYTWTKLDLQEGDNEIWVYYGSGTATDESDGDGVFEFFDDFSSNTVDDYTWTSTDTNPPTNEHTWDSANEWVHILTGDDDAETAARDLEAVLSSGYAQIRFIKRTDYPADNHHIFSVKQDDNNYYKFLLEGSYYSNQGVYKVVGGSTVDSSTETGTVNTDDHEYIWECWWTPTSLRMDVDRTTRKNISTSNTLELSIQRFSFGNSQADVDWTLILFAKYSSSPPSISYSSEETGSWTIDGHTFTKRKKVTITSSQALSEYQVQLDYSQWNESGIRIVGKTLVVGDL